MISFGLIWSLFPGRPVPALVVARSGAPWQVFLPPSVSLFGDTGGVRASRLLSTLLLLQTRGRMTAQELADELEVSVRTAYRDLDALLQAGVPIYADRGPGGGYQLVEGYRTRLTGLTAEEAEALTMTGLPGPAAELGLGTVLAAAELKLQASLPPELAARSERVRQRFHLDAPGWFKDPDDEPTPFLGLVSEAVWGQRAIEVRYGTHRGESRRRLEPLGLVLKAGTWYVVAQVTSSSAPTQGEVIRTYKVSRLLEVELLDERFDWPDDFDLGASWAAWSARFEASMIRGEATVRISPRGYERFQFWWNTKATALMKDSASEPDADGWRTTKVLVEHPEHARAELLRMGADVEVLEPAELRAMVAESARDLAQIYASPDSETGGS
jgi:predicted DNA-binding transcriptional regulator YafY